MTQINNNKEVQYIWHDGVRIREDQLISMAKRAGSYALAEHYMCSLLAHGTAYGLAYIIDKANEIREYYQVGAIPKPNMDDDSVPSTSVRRISKEDKMRKAYCLMTIEERIELIKASLGSLRANYPKLFRFKNQWQGIYLVVHDRLDGGLSQTDFMTMASVAIPDNWPAKLAIAKSVFKNMRRDFRIDDPDEAYYEMDYNPYRTICDAFWEVLKQIICGEKEGI